jgi:hypothetical protein
VSLRLIITRHVSFQTLSLELLYRRYRIASLMLVAGLVMLLSFLWYVPAAYRATDMEAYHTYAFREFRFNNVMAMYVNHNLQEYDGPGFILAGTGIEYPPLLSMLIRATAGLGVSDAVTPEAYRNGFPQYAPEVQNELKGNVLGYAWLNYIIHLLFGLLAVFLMANWAGARPWIFAASPLLFLFSGYNWDLIPIALSLAGLSLLKLSEAQPQKGRGYNWMLEASCYALLTVGIWFKLFPLVFLVAALLWRARQKMWRAASVGVLTFTALTLLINLPFALANFDSWSFFLWIHQNRPAELSIWYWLIGDMDPAIVARPDVTATINILSLLVVAGGWLASMALAWKRGAGNFVLPLGCLLLVWWLTFNKVYDPNFDIYLIAVLAMLAAPTWLWASVTIVSINWYIVTFAGLYFASQPSTGESGAWFLAHAGFVALMLRLAVLGVMLAWLVRTLLSGGQTESRRDALHLNMRAMQTKSPYGD